MKWSLILILAIAIAFASGFSLGKTQIQEPAALVSEPAYEPPTSANEEIQKYEWYRVMKVIDGDTLTISKDGKNVTLRLIGLDTPESVDPRTPAQCFGKEASEKAKRVLAGTSVRIETDPSQGELDKYGRLLAYVYAPANSKPGGMLVNEYMIAEGYGHEYTYSLPYKYQAKFKAAERLAREEKKGLWADDACMNDLQSRSSLTPAVNGEYECSRNTYNCSDFTSQAKAQSVFNSCGGSGNDIHKLDSDGDSNVCESLP